MLSLLGLQTVILAWILAIGLIFLVAIKWNRFSKSGLRNFVRRFVILIIIQTLFLSAVGLTINRSGEFYASWADLFGIRSDGNKVAVDTSRISGITSRDIAAGKSLPGGSLVIKKVITGESSGITSPVYVVLPPKIATLFKSNNDLSAYKGNYKVVELFSGYPGVPQTWIGALKGISALESLENTDQIEQTIAIIPNINVEPHEDTECMNYRGGPQVETWLTKDVHIFASKYLGIDNRSWSTFGYSTGGWCAAEIAIRHQDQYSAGISLAGYFEPSFAFGTTEVERKYLASEYNLSTSLSSGANTVRLLVIASKNDQFSYESTTKFLRANKSIVSIKYDEIPSGGHNLSVWRPYVPVAFLWLKQNAF